MFIGRRHELEVLNNLYASNKFEFMVIYGKKGVGKTSLISHFIDDKNAIYFMGVETNEKMNLEYFIRSIFEYSLGLEADTSFSSFQIALEYVFKLSLKERLILVLDEYPYIARSSKSFGSTLQMLIDKYKDSSKLMLILCGSSISYMEDHVLAYKAPLYGRKTAQIKLLPFDFYETISYLKNFNDEDKALIYGIFGGTPQYLLQVNDKLSVEENIKNTFLNLNSFLYDEPMNLLKQEVREVSLYNGILNAIASGASKMKEIADKIGEDTNTCAMYLKNLLILGIVNKETPYGEDISRKTIYALDDNMFCFSYRFVIENISFINRGAKDHAYKRIEPLLPSYMGKVFEEICKQYLWKLLLNGKTPLEFYSLGRWWGNDKNEKTQVEIDIMGEQDKNVALFGECKWTNEKIDSKVLDTLIKRSKLFPYKKVYYYLFAKSGFTDGCIKAARELGNVTLITYKEMLNIDDN